MSGGHWGYSQYQIRNQLHDVGIDGQVQNRFPKLAQMLRDLATTLEQIIHDLDWDLSSDSMIENDAEFEMEALDQIGRALGKKCTFRIYEMDEE